MMLGKTNAKGRENSSSHKWKIAISMAKTFNRDMRLTKRCRYCGAPVWPNTAFVGGTVYLQYTPGSRGTSHACSDGKRWARLWGYPSTMDWRDVDEENLARGVDGMLCYTDELYSPYPFLPDPVPIRADAAIPRLVTER